jgi:hypothetical protein
VKKLITVLLLNVYLFNLGGYSLVLQCFIHQSEVQIIKEKYENKLDSTKLVEITLPIHLSGICDQTTYVADHGHLQLKKVGFIID